MFNWLPMLLIVSQLGIRSIAVNPILYLLVGESYPTEIRTFAVGITCALEYGMAAISIKLYPDMKYYMGLHLLCYFYAILGFCNGIWGYLTIKDNRSKSLTEIENSYMMK